MTALVFRLGDVRVKLDATVVADLRRRAQTGWCDRESGGVLLGREIEGATEFVVDEVTMPMRGDQRGRRFFNRRDAGHQCRLDEVWEASGGRVGYLGEWHTHPEPVPSPSGIDLGDWRRRLRHDTVPASESLFIIVGTKQIRVWRGDRRTMRIDQMSPDGSELPSEGRKDEVVAAKKKAKKRSKAPSHPDCKDVTRHIKGAVRWSLIAGAGGKCQFKGCRRYLFEHHVTKDVGNFAELAHIIAFSPSGPRGADDVLPKDVHAIENLLLLCPTCHHKIDTQAEKYPVDKLRRWKREHEERVRWLLDLTEESESAVLEIWTDLSNPPVVRSREKVVKAIQPMYPSKRFWEIVDLAGNGMGDEALVGAATGATDERIRQLFKSNGDRPARLAVVGITHMPLLTYLGARLGDRIQLDLFQHHRDTSSWVWNDEESQAEFATTRIQKGTDASKVALVLSLSDSVIPDDGLKGSTVPVDDTFTVYEMRLASATPNRDFLRTREDLERFRQEYRDFYALFAKRHKMVEKLRVFPAVPVPIAIALGAQRLPKIHPTLEMFDEDRQYGGWRHVLDV